MKNFYLLFSFLITSLFIQCNAQPVAGQKGEVIFDSLSGRKMQIYLPTGYHTSGKNYPVIYMNDGQNLFFDSTSAFGEWKIDEILDSLIASGLIEPVIVAGIYNSPRRAEEYVPYKDEFNQKNFGVEVPAADKYADFLINEIIPYIDSKYRSIPKAEARGIMGSSFGGIQALYSCWYYSGVFKFCGALSPSIWVGNYEIFKDFSSKPKPEIKIWTDLGTEEWQNMPEFLDILIDKGFNIGNDLAYLEVKNGKHNEKAWAERVANAFIFFFGKTQSSVTELKLFAETTKGRAGIKFRVNPVATFSNGMIMSLYRKTSLTAGSGKNTSVYPNGYVDVKDLKVEIISEYQGLKATAVFENAR